MKKVIKNKKTIIKPEIIIENDNKSLGGRPAKYNSAEELDKKLEQYLVYCEFEPGNKGRLKKRRPSLIPNKAGFCLFLGISRDTYNEYRKRFPDAIKKADVTIEEQWVQRLKTNAPTGAIFYLKNAFKSEYKDRHETDITSKGDKIESFNETQLERIAGRISNGSTPGKA